MEALRSELVGAMEEVSRNRHDLSCAQGKLQVEVYKRREAEEEVERLLQKLAAIMTEIRTYT